MALLTACHDAPPAPTKSSVLPVEPRPLAPASAAVEKIESSSKATPTVSTPPVQARVLARFLPAPDGYDCGTPDLTDSGDGGTIATQAKTTCKQGGKVVDITLTDHVRNPTLLAPLHAVGKNVYDGPTMFIEPIHHHAADGILRHVTAEQHGHIELLVADRFLLVVDATNVSKTETEALEKLLPEQKLATYEPPADELMMMGQ